MRTQDVQTGIWRDSLVHSRSPRLDGLLREDCDYAQVTMEAACTPDLVYTTDIVVRETRNSLRLTHQGSVCVLSIAKTVPLLLLKARTSPSHSRIRVKVRRTGDAV